MGYMIGAILIAFAGILIAIWILSSDKRVA